MLLNSYGIRSIRILIFNGVFTINTSNSCFFYFLLLILCVDQLFYPLQQFQTTYPFAEKYYPYFLQIHLSPHPNMAPALLHKQPALAPEYCHLMHKMVMQSAQK